MLYANMHSIVVGVTFQVTMYDQSFLASSHSIQRALDMLQLESCCNLSHVFHISFWSFKLSLEGSLMTSRPHSMVFISFFPCIFPLLASPSYHGSLLHFSHTPFTLPPIEHKSKNHLLGLFTLFSQTSNLISAR